MWCSCGFRGPAFYSDPGELGLKEKEPVSKEPTPKRNKAPWPDYFGVDIYEGDRIAHPFGVDIYKGDKIVNQYRQEGTVIYHPNREDPGDAWCVDYGDGIESRLCLQIGYRGQAVVVKKKK